MFQAIEVLWLISLELSCILTLINNRFLVKNRYLIKNVLINFLIKCYIAKVIDQKQMSWGYKIWYKIYVFPRDELGKKLFSFFLAPTSKSSLNNCTFIYQLRLSCPSLSLQQQQLLLLFFICSYFVHIFHIFYI